MRQKRESQQSSRSWRKVVVAIYFTFFVRSFVRSPICFFFYRFQPMASSTGGRTLLSITHQKLMLWRERTSIYFVVVPSPMFFCLSQPSGLIFSTRLGCFEKWTLSLSLARLSSLSRSYFISMFVYVHVSGRCSVQSHVPHFRPDGHVHPPTLQRIITTTNY